MAFIIEDYLNLTNSLSDNNILDLQKHIEKAFFMPSYELGYKNSKYVDDIFKLLNNYNVKNYVNSINKGLQFCDIAIKKDIVNKDLYSYIKGICYLNLKEYDKSLNLLKGINKKYILSCGDDIYLKYSLAFAEIFYMEKDYIKALKVINDNKKDIDKSLDTYDIFQALDIYFENNEFDKMYYYCEKILLNIDIYKNFSKNKLIKLLLLMTFYVEQNKINFLTIKNLMQISRIIDFKVDKNNIDLFFEKLESYFLHIRKDSLTNMEKIFFEKIKITLSNVIIPSSEKLYSSHEETKFASKLINSHYEEVFEELSK